MKNSSEYISNACLVIGIACWSFFGTVYGKIVSENDYSSVDLALITNLLVSIFFGSIAIIGGWQNYKRKSKYHTNKRRK